MAEFHLTPRLDELVAAMIAPEVGKIADRAGQTAKRLAPPTKTWWTMMDDKVRMPHVHAQGDELPNNLRFKLTAFAWDLEHPGSLPVKISSGGSGGSRWPDAQTVPGRHSYLLAPRDKTQGHFVQIVNCRCQLKIDPQGVAKMIRVTEPYVLGTKVTATVIAEGDYVVEAERGDVYPGGMVAKGTFFMQRMVAAMRAG